LNPTDSPSLTCPSIFTHTADPCALVCYGSLTANPNFEMEKVWGYGNAVVWDTGSRGSADLYSSPYG
jgi:hypothetical protein